MHSEYTRLKEMSGENDKQKKRRVHLSILLGFIYSLGVIFAGLFQYSFGYPVLWIVVFGPSIVTFGLFAYIPLEEVIGSSLYFLVVTTFQIIFWVSLPVLLHKKKITVRTLATIFILLWVISYFTIIEPESKKFHGYVRSEGFEKIKPIHVLMTLTSDGNFTGSFDNVAVGEIMVNKSGLRIFDGVECETYTVDKDVVEPGDMFKISASGCRKGVIGEAYKLHITIPYTRTIKNKTTTSVEQGYFKGPIG